MNTYCIPLTKCFTCANSYAITNMHVPAMLTFQMLKHINKHLFLFYQKSYLLNYINSYITNR